MAFCHGNGNLGSDGCCYVAGVICANRWKIVDGRILEGPELLDRGTVEEFVASVANNPGQAQRIVDQVAGSTFVCKVAVNVIANDASTLNNRGRFEQAWADHPDYQPVADAWEAIGKPRSWCPEYGPAEGQCCYAEAEAENQFKRQGLSASAVQIRQGRSV